MIAFYYGLTGFACVWYYRKSLTESTRSFWLRGVLPLLGGVILWFAMFWSLWNDWVDPVAPATQRGPSRERPGNRRGFHS